MKKENWFVKEVPFSELQAELNAFDEQGYDIFKLGVSAQSDRETYWFIVARKRQTPTQGR